MTASASPHFNTPRLHRPHHLRRRRRRRLARLLPRRPAPASAASPVFARLRPASVARQDLLRRFGAVDQPPQRFVRVGLLRLHAGRTTPSRGRHDSIFKALGNHARGDVELFFFPLT